MSALEIMDPKMDAGMPTTGFKTFEVAIKSGAAPIQLTIQQLVDVFDHMLACEKYSSFSRLLKCVIYGIEVGEDIAESQLDYMFFKLLIMLNHCKTILLLKGVTARLFMPTAISQGIVPYFDLYGQTTRKRTRNCLVSTLQVLCLNCKTYDLRRHSCLFVRPLIHQLHSRSINILSWEDTLAYFEKLLQDLDRICYVPMPLGLESYNDHVESFTMTVVNMFSCFCFTMKKRVGGEPLATAVVKVFYVPQNVMTSDHQTQAFTTQSARVTQHLLKIMCTNIACQRRKLGRILQDWGNLQKQFMVKVASLLPSKYSSLT